MNRHAHPETDDQYSPWEKLKAYEIRSEIEKEEAIANGCVCGEQKPVWADSSVAEGQGLEEHDLPNTGADTRGDNQDG
ncbi:hypothetical protein OAA60_00735 [Porticoccaceae bacterium]|nr:hypothetical protein [Porticoccaceae bacterium]